MPVVDQTAFRSDLTREMRPPLVGDLVVGRGTLEQLKVPESVLLKPESVGPFMATQWVRLNEITGRPEIKTIEGEIPEYIHDDALLLQTASGLTADEKKALEAEGALLAAQATDIDKLTGEVDKFIDQNRDKLSGVTGSMDPFDNVLMTQIVSETAEQKKKWQELLAAAKGNPESVNTILGMRTAQRVTQQLGKLVQMYSYQIDQKERLLAQFDLSNKSGTISQADLAQFNAQLMSSQTDTTTIFQVIQMRASDLERVTVFTEKTNTNIRRPLEIMISNMKT